MNPRRTPAAAALAVARNDHCDCPDCGGTGQIDVVEIVDRATGYGHTEKRARKTWYPCDECDGRGKKVCWHKD